jgi:hypothetical protein
VIRAVWIVVGLLFSLLAVAAAGGTERIADRRTPPHAARASRLGHLPLLFVESPESASRRRVYCAQGRDRSLHFTPSGITYTLSSILRPSGPRPRRSQCRVTPVSFSGISAEPAAVDLWSVKMLFEGARAVPPQGELPTKSRFSFFRGPKSEWRSGLTGYGGLKYAGLWKGIDLDLRGETDRLKYEFTVAPGGDPHRIRLRYRGATEMRVSASGRLEITTPLGGFTDDRPFAYQEIEGRRVAVECAYDLTAPREGEWSCGFRLGRYDRRFPLVIDPVVIVYCGYIGGDSGENGTGLAVASDGSVYVAGGTASTAASLPLSGGPGGTRSGSMDVLLAKVDPSGTALEYCGLIGGGGEEGYLGVQVALGPDESIYLCGATRSEDFPTMVGPSLVHRGVYDVFVLKLDPTGTAIVYSGFIGGESVESAESIAVDAAGAAYLCGTTDSDENSFSVRVGPDLTFNGNSVYNDAFVAKVSPTGEELEYCGYIGGGKDDGAGSIAVDGEGAAYVAGSTSSGDFPVVVGPSLTPNAYSSGFVGKLRPNGTGFSYLGYVAYAGATGNTALYDLSLQPDGTVYASGFTHSTQREDTYLVAVAPGGERLSKERILDGQDDTYAWKFAIGDGALYLAGEARSLEAFPGAIRLGDPSDEFPPWIAKLDLATLEPVYIAFLGGRSTFDRIEAVACDPEGALILVGTCQSDESSFPVRGGPDLTFNGGADTWIARLGDAPEAPPAPTARALSQTEVEVTWGAAAAGITAWKLERAPAAGGFTRLASLSAESVSYADTGLQANTRYRYRLIAAGRFGDSPPGVETSVTTLRNPPRAPEQLTAAAIDQQSIRLDWLDASDDESGFRIDRKTTAEFVQIATTGANEAGYDDQDLASSTTYTYRVRAFNAGGSSAYSNAAGATTLPPPPAAPTDLQAVAFSPTGVDLSWKHAGGDAESFSLERARGFGDFALVASGLTALLYQDRGLTPATRYTYRVMAANRGGSSGYSGEATATTRDLPPTAPTDLAATATGRSEIGLTWKDRSANEQGFEIERTTDGGASYAPLTVKAANTTAHVDSGLAAGTTYGYRIRAHNGEGASDWTVPASATTLPEPPEAPSELTARPLSAAAIRLKWRDNSADEQGFRLERKSGAGDFAPIASPERDSTRHVDRSLKPRTRYVYRIRAYNNGGESANSPEVSATTQTALGGRLIVTSRVDLGHVRVGTRREKPLTVRNSSADERLQVSLGKISGPFTLGAREKSFILEPRQSKAVRVFFRPVKAGPAVGRLRLASTDPNRKKVAIILRGTGLAPR